MPDYNVHGQKNIRKLLAEISEQIEGLAVVDPRLENLRQSLYELSIKTEEIEARLRAMEQHEATGVQLAKLAALVVFVVTTVYLSRFL